LVRCCCGGFVSPRQVAPTLTLRQRHPAMAHKQHSPAHCRAAIPSLSAPSPWLFDCQFTLIKYQAACFSPNYINLI
jgi:hypothetical protein